LSIITKKEIKMMYYVVDGVVYYSQKEALAAKKGAK